MSSAIATRATWPRRMVAVLLGTLSLAPGLAFATIPEEPTRWAAHYDDGRGYPDYGTGLILSPDGSRLFVTGDVVVGFDFYGRPIFETVTIAYDTSNGERVWVRRWSGALAIDPAGEHLFIGTGGALVALDTVTGRTEWLSIFEEPTGDYTDFNARAVAASPDGDLVYATGEIVEYGHTDYATTAFSAQTGDQVWTSFYDSETYHGDRPTAIGVSPDGARLFVTGHGADAYGDPDVRDVIDFDTIAYDARDGAELWVAHHDGGWDDYATALAVAPDGARLYVTGWTRLEIDEDYRFVSETVAYEAATGEEAWVQTQGDPNDFQHQPAHLVVSQDGESVYVAGMVGTIAEDTGDFGVLAYSAGKSDLLWSARVDSGGGSDVPTGLAASPDGERVYLTGRTYGTFVEPATTLALDARLGTVDWASRYAGRQGRGAYTVGLAVSPGGSSVYVTGAVYVYPADYDLLTIAYRSTTCAEGGIEDGPLSGPVHEILEPRAGPAEPLVHGLACDVLHHAERYP